MLCCLYNMPYAMLCEVLVVIRYVNLEDTKRVSDLGRRVVEIEWSRSGRAAPHIVPSCSESSISPSRAST
jgi:hypothetical protein